MADIARARFGPNILDPSEEGAAPPLDKEQLGTILQQLSQGALLGYADEIGGVGSGLAEALTGGSFGEGYDRAVDYVRPIEERGLKDNPISGQIAGTLGSFALPGIAPLRLGKLATSGLPTRLLGLLGESAAGGMAQGALAGFGQGEGLENRLDNAWEGAKSGAEYGIPFGVVGGLKGFLRGKKVPRMPSQEVPVSVRDAAEMHASGHDPEAISEHTGLQRDEDGTWRPSLAGALGAEGI